MYSSRIPLEYDGQDIKIGAPILPPRTDICRPDKIAESRAVFSLLLFVLLILLFTEVVQSVILKIYHGIVDKAIN